MNQQFGYKYYKFDLIYLKKLKDDIFGFGSEYAMYYETKNKKMMYANYL